MGLIELPDKSSKLLFIIKIKQMKKLVTGLSAVAAVVGAFAFTPHHFANKVVARQNTNGTFAYENTSWDPDLGLVCQTATTFVCTFSTTATAAFFNNAANHFTGVGQFPANHLTTPVHITYGPDVDKIYLPL